MNMFPKIITKPESLSKSLNKLALCIERNKLDMFHKKKCIRLNQLIRSEQIRFREMYLLQHIVESERFGCLVAVEYIIDDGSYFGQTGDALFYDGDIFRVVECKLVKATHEIFRLSRRQKVKEQAETCVKRIKSWLQHLGSLDDWMKPLSMCKVIPITLTDEDEDVFHKRIPYEQMGSDDEISETSFLEEYYNYF